MNKFIAVVLSTLLLASMALADHPDGGKRKARHKDRLINKLELTEEQKQPVADILKEQWEKRREIMGSAFEQVRPQMEALHEETRQRLADVLSGEQLQKYDELSSSKYERMQRRHSRK